MTCLFSLSRLRAALAASVSGAAILLTGCTGTTTRDDVADARAALEQEQEETAVVIREGEQDIVEARREAYEASKPVLEEGRQDIAAVKRDVAETIRAQRKEEQKAVDNLRTAEQALDARQTRDAYVKQVEHDLANIQLEINQLKDRAANAEGDQKEDLDQQIETLQAQHDRAEDALEELKNADLDDWQVHEQHVRIAMQDLDSRLNNLR
jgi:hypothetical protein